MEFIVDGRKALADTGSSAEGPPSIVHSWRNASAMEVRLIAKIQPAARFEQLMRTLMGLMRDGKLPPKRMALFRLVVAKEFDDVIRLAPHPVGLRLLFALAAPLNRSHRGSNGFYRLRHPGYSRSRIVLSRSSDRYEVTASL